MRTLLLISLTFLLFILISCMGQSQFAHAQEPFQTPTPLPTVQAQLTDAQQRANAAQGMIDQANRMTEQAAEYLRNGIAQQQQAQEDIGKALAAVAAQNYEAIGESIGNAKSDLEQLSTTNSAQHDLIMQLTDNQKAQAAAVISASVEINQLQSDLQDEKSAHQTARAAYAALQNQQAQDTKTSAVGNIVAAFEFIVVLVLLFAFGAFIVTRRRNGVTITTATAEVIEPRDDERADDNGASDDSTSAY